MEEIDICRKVCSVNGISPDENRNVNIDVGAKTVNNIAPDDNGNVTIEVSGGTVKSVNNVNPDANGNVSLPLNYLPLSGGNITGGLTVGSKSVLTTDSNLYNFRNMNLNSFNIDDVCDYNYTLSISEDGHGTRPIGEWVHVQNYNSNHFFSQIAETVNAGDTSVKRMFSRSKWNGGSWSTWGEISVIDTQNIYFFDANGCYHGWIRYSNGLQICWGKKYITDDNNRTVTYFAPFYDFPIVTAVCNEASRMSVSQEETRSTVKFYVWDNNGNSRTYVGVRYIAIGRWK